MSNEIIEAIATADAHLNNVGVPTYTDLECALRYLMEYAGGWDTGKFHPCGHAARIIGKLHARQSVETRLDTIAASLAANYKHEMTTGR